MYMLVLRHTLSVVNANVEFIYETKLPPRHNIKHEKTLEQVRKILKEISDIFKVIEKIHGGPLLVIVMNLEIDLFTNIYVFLQGYFQSSTRDELGFDISIITLMMFIRVSCWVVFICSICQMVIAEFNGVKLKIHTIPTNGNALMSKKVN